MSQPPNKFKIYPTGRIEEAEYIMLSIHKKIKAGESLEDIKQALEFSIMLHLKNYPEAGKDWPWRQEG